MSIELNSKFFINLFFGKYIKRLRDWKIKRYKVKKVKSEAKNSPEKIYHMHFKISIRDKDGIQQCDNDLFTISIPAQGYYYAKKKLEQFVVANIDVEIVDFNSEVSEQLEEEECEQNL